MTILGPQDIVLQTRTGTDVPNELLPEEHSGVLTNRRDFWESRRREVRFRTISATYNCVGMVFASRRVSVHPDEIATFLRDDGYRQLDSRAELQSGDLVLYLEGQESVASHIGVVQCCEPLRLADGSQASEMVIWVLSKWGRDGEYVHKIEDVPIVFGDPREFWTDRIVA